MPIPASHLFRLLLASCFLVTSLVAVTSAKQDNNPVFQTVIVEGGIFEDPALRFSHVMGKGAQHRIWTNTNNMNFEVSGDQKFRIFDVAYPGGMTLDDSGLTVQDAINIESFNGPEFWSTFITGEDLTFIGGATGEPIEFLGNGAIKVNKDDDNMVLTGEGLDIVDGATQACIHSLGFEFTDTDTGQSTGIGLAGEYFVFSDDPFIALRHPAAPNWFMANDNGQMLFGIEGGSDTNNIRMLETGGMQVKTGNKLVELENDDARLFGSNPELKLESTAAGNSIVARANGASSHIRVSSTSGNNQNMLSLKNNAPVTMTLNNTSNANWAMSSDADGRYVITLIGTNGAEFALEQNGRLRIGLAGSRMFDLDPNGNLFLSGTLTYSSDRNKKKAYKAVDTTSVLNKVASMPITTWQYKTDEDDLRHMGPMAQDFRAAFGLGKSDKTLATIDGIGVSLAAIKGLNRKVEKALQQKDDRIADLEDQLQQKDDRISDLEDQFRQLVLRMESLESSSTK